MTLAYGYVWDVAVNVGTSSSCRPTTLATLCPAARQFDAGNKRPYGRFSSVTRNGSSVSIASAGCL
jgi:hypothetical protein